MGKVSPQDAGEGAVLEPRTGLSQPVAAGVDPSSSAFAPTFSRKGEG